MSIGFPASYTEQIEQSGSRDDAREAASYAFDALGWKYEQSDRDIYKAELEVSGSSWGETVTVSFFEPGVVIVENKCSFPFQIFDWGKNRRNVRTFIEHFLAKEQSDLQLDPIGPAHFDARGNSPVERLFSDDDDDVNDQIETA